VQFARLCRASALQEILRTGSRAGGRARHEALHAQYYSVANETKNNSNKTTTRTKHILIVNIRHATYVCEWYERVAENYPRSQRGGGSVCFSLHEQDHATAGELPLPTITTRTDRRETRPLFKVILATSERNVLLQPSLVDRTRPAQRQSTTQRCVCDGQCSRVARNITMHRTLQAILPSTPH
jgi:hypothetical protein